MPVCPSILPSVADSGSFIPAASLWSSHPTETVCGTELAGTDKACVTGWISQENDSETRLPYLGDLLATVSVRGKENKIGHKENLNLDAVTTVASVGPMGSYRAKDEK